MFENVLGCTMRGGGKSNSVYCESRIIRNDNQWNCYLDWLIDQKCIAGLCRVNKWNENNKMNSDPA